MLKVSLFKATVRNFECPHVTMLNVLNEYTYNFPFLSLKLYLISPNVYNAGSSNFYRPVCLLHVNGKLHSKTLVYTLVTSYFFFRDFSDML